MATAFTLSGYDGSVAYEDSALGDTGNLAGALGRYLRRIAEPNRFDNYEMVPLATQATIPMGSGRFMTIPSFTNDSTHGVKTQAKVAANLEALPLSSDGVSPTLANLRQAKVSTITREMTYFADGFLVSKIYKNLATVQGEMERIAQFIMKSAAQTQEKLLQNNIIYEAGSDELTDPNGTGGTLFSGVIGQTSGPVAGEFIYVSPNPDNTAWGAFTASDTVVANQFALARKYLRQYGTPGFSKLGGRLAAIVGPDTVYRLHTQVVDVSTHPTQAALTFEQESMNRTRVYSGANWIGDLFGFRLIETNYPITYGVGTGTPGDTANVACEANVLFGPDAFYVTPHANLSPQIYVSGFEPSIFDPTGNAAVVAQDHMYGAIRGPEFATKVCIMPCATI